MKNIRSQLATLAPLALVALLSTLNSQVSTLLAQGTAFTYQGILNASGIPVTGLYDFSFNLYTNVSIGNTVAPELIRSAVGVTNGLFSTSIEFGPVFNGTRYWLEIASRPAGSGAFQVMTPRQELTPTPYSILSESAVGGSGASGWVLGGNGGIPNGSFVGTTDNHPLELRVNNARALRLELNTFNASNAPNVIGGAVGNFVVFPGVGATIAGGGALNYGADPDTNDPGVSYTNSVTGDFGTVSGGAKNTSAFYGTVGGGEGNTSSQSHATVGGGAANHSTGSSATVGGGAVNTSSGSAATVGGGSGNLAGADAASVGGGQQNHALGANTTIAGGTNNSVTGFGSTVSGGGENTAGGDYATVGGGAVNNATALQAFIGGGNHNTNSAWASVIGGGQLNHVDVGAFDAVIGGGFNNYVSPGGVSAMIPGGSGNSVSGSGSFAAGVNAHANHDGSFVWGDGTGWAGSAGPNRFEVRATGGFNFYCGPRPVTIDPSGTLNVPVLTIYGGSDVAEPFQMSRPETPKGAVVVIDEENPGKLKLSDHAYDHRVAGIVSGANGIKPGIALHQEGVFEGGQNVALSGRVYVLADASSGPIRPGDLLTTSGTPGHAMKVADHAKAQGAILGKAMSSLDEGKGMVLVLVSLQ